MDVYWYVQYYFYPHDGKRKETKVKANINRFKTLGERQIAMRHILQHVQQMIAQDSQPAAEISPATGFIPALRATLAKINVTPFYRQEIGYIIDAIEAACSAINYSLLIKDVERWHIKNILESMNKSPARYNAMRTALSILFSELVEYGSVKYNPVRDLKKKKVTRAPKKIPTQQQRKIIRKHLAANHPMFWRFVNIFYHSGARISELMRVQAKHVDLQNQTFTVLVKKGRQGTWQQRIIKDKAVQYWDELLKYAVPDGFIFSHGWQPGTEQMSEKRPLKVWDETVIKELGIKVTLYSLKHLHSTEVSELLSQQHAALANGHTSVKMVQQVYDVNSKRNAMLQVKGLGNEL